MSGTTIPKRTTKDARERCQSCESEEPKRHRCVLREGHAGYHAHRGYSWKDACGVCGSTDTKGPDRDGHLWCNRCLAFVSREGHVAAGPAFVTPTPPATAGGFEVPAVQYVNGAEVPNPAPVVVGRHAEFLAAVAAKAAEQGKPLTDAELSAAQRALDLGDSGPAPREFRGEPQLRDPERHDPKVLRGFRCTGCNCQPEEHNGEEPHRCDNCGCGGYREPTSAERRELLNDPDDGDPSGPCEDFAAPCGDPACSGCNRSPDGHGAELRALATELHALSVRIGEHDADRAERAASIGGALADLADELLEVPLA